MGIVNELIAVFFDAPAYEDYPFTKEEYVRSYHQFAGTLHIKGSALCIVRGQNSYMGGNTFAGGWIFNGASFVRSDSPLQVGVIYDKGHFVGDAGANLLNDAELDAICTSKSRTWELFQSDCPRTIEVHTPAMLSDALEKLSGKLIVAKPVDGEEGHGVLIGSKEEVSRYIASFPYLIQEYIDTTGGIPNITEGAHDFRIVSINGEPIIAFVRTPPPGSYLANVSQGGSTIEVPINDIPEEALKIFTNVDGVLKRFPRRVYSLDMGRDANGRWMIIELNSKPALFSRDRGPEFARFHERLADVLISANVA